MHEASVPLVLAFQPSLATLIIIGILAMFPLLHLLLAACLILMPQLYRYCMFPSTYFNAIIAEEEVKRETMAAAGGYQHVQFTYNTTKPENDDNNRAETVPDEVSSNFDEA